MIQERHRSMQTYTLVALIHDTGEMIDLRVAAQGDELNALARSLPEGVRPYEYAVTPAPSAEAAYIILMHALLVEQQDDADRFWERVRRIPRIRVAAIRRMGLRAIGPVLAHVLGQGTHGSPYPL